jgi:aminotransferase
MIDYNKILSDKAKQIKPSGIRKFFDIVTEMKDAILLEWASLTLLRPGISEKRAYFLLNRERHITLQTGV